MAYQHTKECNEAYKKAAEEKATYDTEWPHHCRTCGGEGGFSYPATRWEPGGYEPCEDCIWQNKCPRCGKEDPIWESGDQVTCPHCGFDDRKPETMPPGQYECWGCADEENTNDY